MVVGLVSVCSSRSCSRGFTLIEMVVTIAVIAIVTSAIVISLAPAQRLSDARESKAKHDVRALASAVEACLSYTDSDSGVSNTAGFCASGSNLSGSSQGGPYVRGAIPPQLNFGYSGSLACIWETIGGSTWKYTSGDGKVILGSASCP